MFLLFIPSEIYALWIIIHIVFLGGMFPMLFFSYRYRTWDFLRIEKVVWRVLPSQTLTLIAMISVVGLSSSLDIAAIEIELKRPLNYNFELKTVGISNIISGMFGGYTGSYIFSQVCIACQMESCQMCCSCY